MRISDWSSDVCSSDLYFWLLRLQSITQNATLVRSGGSFLFFFSKNSNWVLATIDNVLVDHNFVHAIKCGQIKHGIKQNAFENRSKAARSGLAFDRTLGDRRQRILREAQLYAFHVEQLLILIDQRILWFGHDLVARRLIQVLKRDRKSVV